MRPSGNSSASWCLNCSFLFTCRKIAVAYPSVFAFQPTTKRGSVTITALENARLGPRENADRHCIVFRRSEPTCAGAEVSCGEFVADLCWPRPDVEKAVVTHCENSLLEASLMNSALAASWFPN